jgi:hypothetical protein
MPSFLEKRAATRQQLLRKKSAKRIQKQTGGQGGPLASIAGCAGASIVSC